MQTEDPESHSIGTNRLIPMHSKCLLGFGDHVGKDQHMAIITPPANTL